MNRLLKMNRLFEIKGLILAVFLCLSLMLSGCNQTVCNQYWLKDKPDSILINTGIRGIQLPPITDPEKISQVVIILKDIDFEAKDETEIVGVGTSIQVNYPNRKVEYFLLGAREYLLITVDGQKVGRYRVTQKSASQLQLYMEHYIKESLDYAELIRKG